MATEFPMLDFEVGLEVDQDAEGMQVMEKILIFVNINLA